MTERSYTDGFSDIKRRYGIICENIEKAKAASGRTDKVRLMAVTKTVSAERVNYAAELGIDLLGENRVQEFLEKSEKYSKKVEIHFIGGLQNNKVKYIIDKVSMIHSLNSVKLAEEIQRRAQAAGIIIDVLVEVNIANEPTKSGISPDTLEMFADQLASFENIRLRGLMAIPPININGSSECYYADMQQLFNRLKLRIDTVDTLSMGMSGDYETAVRYGATIIRIGSGLFGARNYGQISDENSQK